MKKFIIEFYRGLYVGSIPLAVGLVFIAVSQFKALSVLSFFGVVLMAMGIYQLRVVEKYRDQEPSQHD